MDNRPIGVFDSGLGGLTAVKELLEIMPQEHIVYFGDTGRVPYGCLLYTSFSMVHGDFLAALHYNAFFLLAFPFVAYYLIKQYIRFVFRKDPLPFFQIGLSAYNGIMLLVLLFWVLRNIPVFPFSLLAP